MKMKYKQILAFFSSTALSVTIFLFFVYYVLHNGYFSGINTNDMKQALDRGGVILSESREWQKAMEELEKIYPQMKFALLTEEDWYSTADVPAIITKRELFDAINETGQTYADYKIMAAGVTYKGEDAILICYVDNQDFEAMSYKFNTARAQGILGKIGIVGIVITVAVTGVFLSVLQRQYEEKEHYEKNRKELVSNISHDLRTPLSSIVGYSEMLQTGIYESEAEKASYIDIIHRKALYMEKLLNELLEFSRLELKTLRLQKSRMDLSETVREILIEYYPEFEKNKYELELEFPEFPVIGEWDKEQLSRVIRNLIDNALKYGMNGKKLRIVVQQEEKQVLLEIQDFGEGITQKALSHVTERFYRSDNARSSNTGGMGLGLFIVQEIVKLHSGTFEIESKINQGTRMKISLPINL